MIMGFHLHQNMHGLLMKLILLGSRFGIKAARHKAFHHRRVIRIGGKHALAARLVGVFDHFEQGERLCLTVHHPIGIEDFVTTMLRVSLGKHHQFHVCGVSLQLIKTLQQIIDFVLRQRQSKVLISTLQRRTPPGQHIHFIKGCGLILPE